MCLFDNYQLALNNVWRELITVACILRKKGSCKFDKVFHENHYRLLVRSN